MRIGRINTRIFQFWSRIVQLFLRVQAQLVRETAALKAKLSSMQLSVAQAESANAASADTILRLQAEVASAIHLQRLAQGADFMTARKEAQKLSVSPTC
jgi:hypothetical protein